MAVCVHVCECVPDWDVLYDEVVCVWLYVCVCVCACVSVCCVLCVSVCVYCIVLNC